MILMYSMASLYNTVMTITLQAHSTILYIPLYLFDTLALILFLLGTGIIVTLSFQMD